MLKTIVATDLSKINVDTGKFDQLAGWALGTAIVLVAIALIVWAMIIPIVRRQGKSAMGDGLNKMALGVVAAALLSGSVSFATWNSTSATTTALMPANARTGSLTVEKKPALTTCPATVNRVYEFDNEAHHQISYEVLRELVGDSGSAPFKDQVTESENGKFFTKAENAVSGIEWFPTGPNCTSDNLEAQSGTAVKVYYHTTDKPWAVGSMPPPAKNVEIQVK